MATIIYWVNALSTEVIRRLHIYDIYVYIYIYYTERETYSSSGIKQFLVQHVFDPLDVAWHVYVFSALFYGHIGFTRYMKSNFG